MIIPFFIPHAGCPHQCVFCNQKTITGQSRSVDALSIPHTVNTFLTGCASQEPVQIAFYGGSFTALPIYSQRDYLEACQPFISAGKITSIRLSTRPDNISREILAFLKSYNVETIELGVQSMNDQVLVLSGRGHTVADTLNAVALIHESGFTLGLQLMPGLPGDSAVHFMETITAVIELKPTFVRIYPAVVITGTPLEELYRSGRYAPLTLADAVSICGNALVKFKRAGIGVIRMGLQPTKELEKPGMIVAGPYHPAFRQLVESSIYLEIMRAALRQNNIGTGPSYFHLHPADVSAAIGQKRSNIKQLIKEFGLASVHVIPDTHVPRGEIRYQ